MDLSLADFEGFVGESYELVFTDGTLPIVLEKAESLPRSMREAGAFRLEWRGLADPILIQAIYRFRRGEQEFDMFIVPVGRDSTGTLYEAIFN
ncbi:MAG TPA: hypothetical protein VFQ67_10145 [Allosphingosinicella sp.]|jgi:hypothetical protein|nr:hypothetical protein [Allosphingosinicella sp.]